MSEHDREAMERRLAAWLAQAAPAPPPDVGARLLARTAVTRQRGRAAPLGAALKAVAAAAVVVTAVYTGQALAGLLGPASETGTPPPVVSDGPAPSGSVPPDANASPTAAPSTPDAASPPAAATPSAAPTPGRIAFQANRANDTSGIYLMDPDGSNVVGLVDDPAVHETAPFWLPDGSHLAYTTLAVDSRTATYLLDVTGGGAPVLVSDRTGFGGDVSPDGTLWALGGDGGPPSGISVYALADGTLQQLTSDGGISPLWSPDGTRIAYTVQAPNDIWILDVATGETRNLTNDPWSNQVARWTDDGEGIVYVSDRDTDETKGSARSWVIPADGGEPQLLGDVERAFAYWPSPDGEWIAYAAEDGSGLRLSRADGSEDRAVHPTTPADAGPSWAVDSSGFVFSNATDAPREIFLMRVDAATPVQLTDHPADDSSPSWGAAPGE